jgi:hypothetical protein
MLRCWHEGILTKGPDIKCPAEKSPATKCPFAKCLAALCLGYKRSGMQKVRDIKGPDIKGTAEFCPVIDMWMDNVRNISWLYSKIIIFYSLHMSKLYGIKSTITCFV